MHRMKLPLSEEPKWICNVPLGITISVMGIIGNVLSVYVWYRVIKKNREGNHSTAVYLITLSLCDIGLLLFFILTESLSTAVPFIKTTYQYGAFLSWFSFPMLCTFVVASTWLVVGVTINRWVLIAFPIRSRDIYSRNNTIFGLVVILFFSVLINVPHWFNFEVVLTTNGTYTVEKTRYGASPRYAKYEFWCHCMVLVLVPWFTIAVLNALMVKKLRERRKITFINCRPRILKEDRNLTIMLMFITCSFLPLIAWQCIAQCFNVLDQQNNNDVTISHADVWYRMEQSYAFGKMGVVVNSGINCLFYGCFGTRYRTELRSFLCQSSVTISSPQNLNDPCKKRAPPAGRHQHGNGYVGRKSIT